MYWSKLRVQFKVHADVCAIEDLKRSRRRTADQKENKLLQSALSACTFCCAVKLCVHLTRHIFFHFENHVILLCIKAVS